MSLQKESGTVKLHLDLSPSCQVKTIDGKPLDFIPEVKIPSLQKESEEEENLDKLYEKLSEAITDYILKYERHRIFRFDGVERTNEVSAGDPSDVLTASRNFLRRELKEAIINKK